MIRIPLPTPALAAITAAFLVGFCWHMEAGNLGCAIVSVIGFTWNLGELVLRFVEYRRMKRGKKA